ncbi:DNA cytosine methyltransferase [Alishewanella sp. SMS9]|nr:DNA cytosine methyltransferase [Alishewanella sp. SMS9]
MNILSLFDGMSCGRIAAERAGLAVTKYYASEVDKYAIKVSQANWPDIIHLGDVTKWREWEIDWASIDLLIGGSPCQGFSFAGKQLAFDDPRSKLFFVYVDILNHIRSVNPDVKFMLENVRMKKEHLAVINQYLGVEPTLINSALVSAQNRLRYYWANWRFGQPIDKAITLPDVLGLPAHMFKIYQKDNPKKPRPTNLKSTCLTGTANAAGNHSQMDVVVVLDAEIPLTSTGRIDIHSSRYVYRYSRWDCEKLQTVPKCYTWPVSNSQAYKMLINGWTVDVIAHIFKHINNASS